MRQPSRRLTVAALWDVYREDRKGRPIAATMKHSPALLAAFGHLRPDRITVEDCWAFTSQRRKAKIKDGTIWTASWGTFAWCWAGHRSGA